MVEIFGGRIRIGRKEDPAPEVREEIVPQRTYGTLSTEGVVNGAVDLGTALAINSRTPIVEARRIAMQENRRLTNILTDPLLQQEHIDALRESPAEIEAQRRSARALAFPDVYGRQSGGQRQEEVKIETNGRMPFSDGGARVPFDKP